MPTVFANSRSILHAGDGNTHVAAPPDVCKVPSPGGPIPTPLVNSAQDSMLSKGSTKTKIESNPVALSDSELSTSSGDEPGTLGGVISSKFKGKMTWSSASTDVKVEGKGVVRFMEPTMHNGNTFNTAFISQGGTGFAYGNDTKCSKCGKLPRVHRVLETKAAKSNIARIFAELEAQLQTQRPLIDEYVTLRAQRAQVDYDSQNEMDREMKALEERKKRFAEEEQRIRDLIRQKGEAAAQADKDRIQATINSRNAALNADPEYQSLKSAEAKIKAKRKAATDEMRRIDERKKQINQELSKKPTLRLDSEVGTYCQGYMVGACICKCPESARMIASCSGSASPGFEDAVKVAQFELASSYTPTPSQLAKSKRNGPWKCAAPKLISKADPHKVKTMSEMWYSPIVVKQFSKGRTTDESQTVSVRYKEVIDDTAKRRTKAFSHGETVPSCATCQECIPEMTCDNHKPCP